MPLKTISALGLRDRARRARTPKPGGVGLGPQTTQKKHTTPTPYAVRQARTAMTRLGSTTEMPSAPPPPITAGLPTVGPKLSIVGPLAKKGKR